MSNVHLIADESLGGVLREYVEVERKAKKGEKIVILRPDEGSVYEKGDVFTVEKSYENHPEYEDGIRVEDDFFFIYHSEYQTIEPTDIVHIDDPSGQPKRYRMVERKAEVGEKIIVVAEEHSNGGYSNGDILDVTKSIDESDWENEGVEVNNARESYLFTKEYLVLEPIETPQSTDDIIANLVRRVSELERRLDGAKDDIETWSREVESVKYANERLGQTITLDVETLVKLIGGVR